MCLQFQLHLHSPCISSASYPFQLFIYLSVSFFLHLSPLSPHPPSLFLSPWFELPQACSKEQMIAVLWFYKKIVGWSRQVKKKEEGRWKNSLGRRQVRKSEQRHKARSQRESKKRVIRMRGRRRKRRGEKIRKEVMKEKQHEWESYQGGRGEEGEWGRERWERERIVRSTGRMEVSTTAGTVKAVGTVGNVSKTQTNRLCFPRQNI